MQYLIITLCLFFLIANYKNDGKIKLYNIVILEFFVITFLYIIKQGVLYDVSQGTFLLIFIGLISFEIGVFVSGKVRYSFQLRISANQIDTMSLGLGNCNKLIIALYLFCIFISSISAFETIRLLGQGYSLYLLRTDPYHLRQLPDWFDFIYVYIIVPLSYVMMGFGIIQLFQNKKLYFIMTLVLALLSTISFGGRETLLFLLAQLFVWLLYFRKKGNSQGENRKRRSRFWLILLTSAFVFVVVMSITTMRGSQQSVFEILYGYTTPSLQLLDYRLKVFNESPTYCFGFFSFRGLIDPILIILKSLHLIPAKPNIFYIASALNTATEETVAVGTSKFMNAFVTYLYAFYVDFDYIGVILFSALYGGVISYFEKRVSYTQSMASLLIYSLFIYMALTSIVRWQLVNPAFAMSFVYCWLIFYPHRIKIKFKRLN